MKQRYLPFSSSSSWAAPILAFTLLLGAAAATRAAEPCCAGWIRPFVCDARVELSRAGEGARPVRSTEPVYLTPGDVFELTATALDQSGRTFPAERVLWSLKLDPGCDRLLRVDPLEPGRFRVTAYRTPGSCQGWLAVPANLNLEWTLGFQVAARGQTGYSRTEAEAIAGRLYRAILGRDPDPAGLASAVGEIQRGRIREQAVVMFTSTEYRTRRAGLSPSALLESLYLGLLDRAPDSDGVRAYLGELERGGAAEVVTTIVGSAEFETRLGRGLQKR